MSSSQRSVNCASPRSNTYFAHAPWRGSRWKYGEQAIVSGPWSAYAHVFAFIQRLKPSPVSQLSSPECVQ